MFEVINHVIRILKSFSPIIFLVLAVIIAASMLKWGKTVGNSFKEILKNPGSFIFSLIVIGLFMYLFFTTIYPLFQQL